MVDCKERQRPERPSDIRAWRRRNACPHERSSRMPVLQLLVLAVLSMVGLAALRLVRVHLGRTPLPDGRGRRLFLIAFVIVPPLVLGVADPARDRCRAGARDRLPADLRRRRGRARDPDGDRRLRDRERGPQSIGAAGTAGARRESRPIPRGTSRPTRPSRRSSRKASASSSGRTRRSRGARGSLPRSIGRASEPTGTRSTAPPRRSSGTSRPSGCSRSVSAPRRRRRQRMLATASTRSGGSRSRAARRGPRISTPSLVEAGARSDQPSASVIRLESMP